MHIAIEISPGGYFRAVPRSVGMTDEQARAALPVVLFGHRLPAAANGAAADTLSAAAVRLFETPAQGTC